MMNQKRSIRKWGICCLAAVVLSPVGYGVLGLLGAFDTETWTRESPLQNPIAVVGVRDGILELADGRSFRPAGIRRLDSVNADQFDKMLRVATEQGVVVERELDDGSAFLTVEPKFHNWCGTRGYQGNRWDHWAGGYFPCSLSLFAVLAEYATPIGEKANLTPIERWRLDHVEKLRPYESGPMWISSTSGTFRFAVMVRELGRVDETLEFMGESPPTSP